MAQQRPEPDAGHPFTEPAPDRGHLERFQSGRDYDVSPDPDYASLARELDDAVEGDVRFDEYTQVLYATDGSIYGARPAGVVLPRETADVQRTVEIATRHDVPVLPRGAGTSLAGQAVGPGCVVIDCSKYMDGVVSLDPDARQVTVQPGLVQDDLDERLATHGLKFAPDPASSNRATIGGGIGNNSTGAHSVRYGITDAYVDELSVVLADGSLMQTREIVLDSAEWDQIVAGDDRAAEIYETVRGLVEDNAAAIESRYPDLKRCVSGYNLDRVIYENDAGDRCINLSKLVVGSEGTLGVVVEATLSLVTVPDTTALVLYCFEDLIEALRAVPTALEHDVSAVELMDEEVFRLAAESGQYAEYAEPIPDGTAAALMLEFDSELVADFEAAIGAVDADLLDAGSAFESIEAYDDATQADLWKLRKAAIPLLMSMEGDPKPYPFIEDATVPPDELASYVAGFEEILADHDTEAAYFAHAGAGTLHIRPILNLKSEGDVDDMRSIAEDVTDLVRRHHGSFSGEHGDGMARTEFNPKMYGPDLWAAFKELKTAFDPAWLLNPGTVVFRDDAADPGPYGRAVGSDMRNHLRYGPAYQSIEPTTELDFSAEGGFSHLVELCNGCGTCRQTGTDTMCPTYRASREEMETTRGRANMLRAAISGELPESELYSDRFQEEVLDLCVGCKGCADDCPTGVDLAKLKAEVKHRYHEREGATIRERLFADIDRWAGVGSRLAPLSNLVTQIPGARRILEELAGIAADRELPSFTRNTFASWMADREPAVRVADCSHRVLVFPDTYTNYMHPSAGRAAVEVLEAANCHVRLASDAGPSGRAAFSLGFLDRARARAEHNVAVLRDAVEDGWSVVFVEPSDAVVFQDEYLDLLDGDAVETVADSSYGVMEFLDANRLDENFPGSEEGVDAGLRDPIAYHGHCNQKAINRDHHAVGVLRRVGYDVDPIDSGCCGMAGSFGYEAEHYDLSKAIGRILRGQLDASPATRVVAPGASCRSQIGAMDGRSMPAHPVEAVRDAIR